MEFEYYGSFKLFERIKYFQQKEQARLKSLKATSPRRSPRKSPGGREFRGILQEITSSKLYYKLLQLDIKQLFLEYKEIYWNLMYRFIKEGKDYIFLLPYEADLEDPSEENSSVESNSDINQHIQTISPKKIDLFKDDSLEGGGSSTLFRFPPRDRSNDFRASFRY